MTVSERTHTFVMVSFGDPNDPSGQRLLPPKPMCLEHGPACSAPPGRFYGSWPELERIEVGDRAAFAYDETSPLMHRMIRAVGGVYDISHNYWSGA